MIDWKVVANVVASALGAGLVAGVGSWQANPAVPWQVHAATAAAGSFGYLAGHLRQSPLPGK